MDEDNVWDALQWEVKELDAEVETVRQFRTIPGGRVYFEGDRATKDKLFDAMLGWFCEHRAFCGESIMQCDEPQIEAAPFLAAVAEDILKFQYEVDDV